MRYVIYGAGAIGATIAARFHQQGEAVVAIARGDHGAAMQRYGLRFIAEDGEHRVALPTVGHPAEIDFRGDDLVILAMKSQHTEAALLELRAAAGAAVGVVCAQNGVANERAAARYFERVYGMLVYLPAMLLEPGQVVTHAAGVGGVLDTGAYPQGVDGTVQTLTAALQRAGFVAQADPEVMRIKYAKLLMNLGNLLQAATQGADASQQAGDPPEAERQAARRFMEALQDEAAAVFAAAAIEPLAGDALKERLSAITALAEIPGHPRSVGSTWQSLKRGTGNLETDYLNGEIVLLGRLHGVATPANALCQRLAGELLERGPGAYTAQQLCDRLGL